MKTRLIFLIMQLLVWFSISAQEVAVKTNLLYDATTTPNVGLEVGVGTHATVQLYYGLNPWKFRSSHGERKANHWLLMPEVRWWTCSKFNGHFFGVHLMGGQFNAANIDIPLPGFFFKGDNLRESVRDFRCQGWYAGGGLTYGYQWMLSRHFNVEAEIGVGYVHGWYDKYPCYECGSKTASCNANYAGLTKLGVSILYIF